ncbi:hypothetical protein HU200_003248 [Digitaria exilis]|uniref:Uncharacterized protein n=1 Tax=Digitaria exilis TaxID=1010633 RepID=A0A835FWW3_9POAL|nr:hypothetical protein HU200_003248 [Digitaria exilis]
MSWNAIFIPFGDRLYAITEDGSFFGALTANWNNFEWSWLELPKPTYQCDDIVSSYAVHPDGNSIFANSVNQQSIIPSITFSCDVAAVPVTRWTQHGLWHLPFTGRGYYEPELDAWVRLSGDLNSTGHICACDVVNTGTEDDSNQQCLDLTLNKKKLFSRVPGEMHIGATLVYMGGGGKFCLLEAIYIKVDDQLTDSEDESGGTVHERNRFFRLTTFLVRYDKNGKLTTMNSRRVSYY